MLKRFLIGAGTLTMLLTGAMLMTPTPAVARRCEVVKIPPGYYPTGVPCGDQLCPGERWQSRWGGSICVTSGEQP